MVVATSSSSNLNQNVWRDASLGIDLATDVFHAVAVLMLVNIQADVIHGLNWGRSLVFLNQRAAKFSFSTKRSSIGLSIQNIQTNRDLADFSG